MATPFNHTLQALIADSQRRRYLSLACVVFVLSVWLAWFFFADVGIYKSAPVRLQTEQDIQAVEASTEGRVVRIHMAVGREVQVGDILVELEDTALRLKLAEQNAKLNAARAQLLTVNAEIAAQEHALADVRKAAPMMRAETQLRYEQAQPAAQLAEDELSRWRTLREGGFVTELQISERAAAARRRHSEVQELQTAVARLELDHRAGEADRQASIERLRRDAAELTGLIAATAEIVRQTEYEIRNYTLRAPASGPLADVAELRPGMIVHSGERLASIVPAGQLKIMADFPPTALGHIRPGQSASVQLDGFPAEQYGRLAASVLRVAQEPRVGKIRVELAMLSRQIAIPLQHGLLGSVEIEVERTSPALLVLRAAGAVLHNAHAQAGE